MAATQGSIGSPRVHTWGAHRALAVSFQISAELISSSSSDSANPIIIRSGPQGTHANDNHEIESIQLPIAGRSHQDGTPCGDSRGSHPRAANDGT